MTRVVDFKSKHVRPGQIVMPIVTDRSRQRPSQVAEDFLCMGMTPTQVMRLVPAYRRARRELVTGLRKRCTENMN